MRDRPLSVVFNNHPGRRLLAGQKHADQRAVEIEHGHERALRSSTVSTPMARAATRHSRNWRHSSGLSPRKAWVGSTTSICVVFTDVSTMTRKPDRETE